MAEASACLMEGKPLGVVLPFAAPPPPDSSKNPVFVCLVLGRGTA